MKSGLKLNWALIPVLISLGCSGPIPVRHIDDDVIRDTSQYKAVVAFDLRRDSNPTCSLVLHQGTTPNGTTTGGVVVLPFPTTRAENNRELLTTWSSLDDCCSLVSYIHLPEKSGAYTVALSPAFSTQPQDLSDLPGQIYLLRLGQERRFIYRYSLPTGREDINRLLTEKTGAMPDAIAVARPSEAKGLEIKGGMTEIPSRKGSNGVAAFYAASSVEAGADHLEVRYELPLSSAQELALKFFAELFGALAPPLAVLFFLDFTDKTKRRLKAILLWVLVLLEVSVISVIGFLAWAERTTQSTETLLSSIVVLAGLAASVVVGYLKKNAVGPTP